VLKIRKIHIILIVLCVLILNGCQQNNPEDYTLPPFEISESCTSGSIYVKSFPRRRSLKEYGDMLESEYIPDSFIYYDDLAFAGDFVEYSGQGTDSSYKLTVESLHTSQYYLIRDEQIEMMVRIRYYETEEAEKWMSVYRDHSSAMPERRIFYEKPVGDDVESFEYEGIYYSYGVESGWIDAIFWRYGNYFVLIDLTPLRTTPLYPEEESDTFVSRLLHADTAVAAKNQLNRAIFWRQTRVFLKKAAPIAIPMICVLAVGIPTLVIYRRKKRRIRIQEEQGESDLA
jgi:hypothetical protein